MEKPNFIFEYFDFLRQQKKWWVFPIISLVLLFGALILLTQDSPLAMFIYSRF